MPAERGLFSSRVFSLRVRLVKFGSPISAALEA